MTAQMVLTIGHEALTLLLMVAMPLLGTIMAVGLLVSVFQAVTQINEQTLSFLPRLIVTLVVLGGCGKWMIIQLHDLCIHLFTQAALLVH